MNRQLPHLGRRNHSIRSEHFRYIHMANGSEGLFDHRKDPGEWNNLADNKEYEEIKKSSKSSSTEINNVLVSRITPFERAQ